MFIYWKIEGAKVGILEDLKAGTKPSIVPSSFFLFPSRKIEA
jgi:hypothetical protein